jgi:hypothetical protein
MVEFRSPRRRANSAVSVLRAPSRAEFIPVHGYIDDVAHGKLTEVEGARAVGASA